MNSDLGNSIYVEITGKRKREAGLVVLTKFSALTKCGQAEKIDDERLLKRKQYFSALELKDRKKGLYRKFHIYRKQKGCLHNRKRFEQLLKLKKIT